MHTVSIRFNVCTWKTWLYRGLVFYIIVNDYLWKSLYFSNYFYTRKEKIGKRITISDMKKERKKKIDRKKGERVQSGAAVYANFFCPVCTRSAAAARWTNSLEFC